MEPERKEWGHRGTQVLVIGINALCLRSQGVVKLPLPWQYVVRKYNLQNRKWTLLILDNESATDRILNNPGCKTLTETLLLLLSHSHPWHFAAAIRTVCLHQPPPLYRHTAVWLNTPMIFKWAFDRSLEVFVVNILIFFIALYVCCIFITKLHCVDIWV